MGALQKLTNEERERVASCLAEAGSLPQRRAAVSWSIPITVRTPALPGAQQAGVVDGHNAIRATAVRGSLRQFWRWLQPPAEKPETLRDEENRLWGSTDNRSAIRICQASKKDCKLKITGWKQAVSPTVSYLFGGAFVGNNDRQELELGPDNRSAKKVDFLLHDSTFRLKIEIFADLDEADTASIKHAIASWLHWGGIGAITRRGLGQLDASEWLQEQGLDDPFALLPNGAEAYLAPLPTGNKNDKTAIESWLDAVEVYRLFRQGFRGGSSDNKLPGQSYWPEPHSIRGLTGQSDPNHMKERDAVFRNSQVFPRAALGAPIVFQFKGKKEGEPGNTTVNAFRDGKTKTRLASPILTRAVFHEGKWRAAIVILDTRHIEGVGFHISGANLGNDGREIPANKVWGAPVEQACSQHNGPMQREVDGKQQGFSNAFDALRNYLTNCTKVGSTGKPLYSRIP